MTKVFKEEDLVSFGNYLLSEDRKQSFVNHPDNDTLEDPFERMKQVAHADIENWKSEITGV